MLRTVAELISSGVSLVILVVNTALVVGEEQLLQVPLKARAALIQCLALYTSPEAIHDTRRTAHCKLLLYNGIHTDNAVDSFFLVTGPFVSSAGTELEWKSIAGSVRRCC